MNTQPRAINRAEDRARQLYKAASELMQAAPAHAETIGKMLEDELGRAPDFTMYRRGSSFVDAPAVNTDRNHCARIMFTAETLERKSWRARKKGKHGGVLGRNAIILLRVLLFVVRKRQGRLFPSFDHLALLCRLSRRAVIEAMRRLIFYGFVTAIRRCKRERTAFGIRVVQDTNAYLYHLPSKGWGLLAARCFVAPSECTNYPARTIDGDNLLSLKRQPSNFEATGPSQGALEDGRAALMAADLARRRA